MNDIEIQNELIYHKILNVVNSGKLQLSGPFLTKIYNASKRMRNKKIEYDGFFLTYIALTDLKPKLRKEKIKIYVPFLFEKFMSSLEMRKAFGY